jgi:hypothetical protein
MQKIVFELLLKNMNIKVHRRLILSAVSYGCEVWSHTLREENRLTVFEKRTQRKTFGPKRNEVTGEWTILHIRKLMICNPHQLLFG